MVFSDAAELRAALALSPGGLRFRCHVCGREHLMSRRQWEKCARRACRDLSAGWLVFFDGSGRERLGRLEVVPSGGFAINGQEFSVDAATLPPIFGCALPRKELVEVVREAEAAWWKKARSTIDEILGLQPALRGVLEAAAGEFSRVKLSRRRWWHHWAKAGGEDEAWLMIRAEKELTCFILLAVAEPARTRFDGFLSFYKGSAPHTPAELFGLLGLR